MPSSYSHPLRKLALIISLGLAVGAAGAAETDPDGKLFQPSDAPLADVREALVRAADSDRLALIVLGANWCHDSRALAARLHQSPLADVIERHYELVMVDVGFLETGRAVAQEFGVANYYATPTVFIVDPSSGKLVDDTERHRWGDAYRISMDDSVAYFEKWAARDAAAGSVAASPELQRLTAQIDAFEQQLADRVAAGYAVVGPMLAAYKAGNEPAAFESSWNELRDFRMAIPGDIRELRDEARQRVAAGEKDIQLTFPEYPPLSWE